MKLEDLNLSAGYPAQLQVSTDDPEGLSCSCRVIGTIPGKSVLLTAPVANKRYVRVRPGQKLAVKLMVANGVAVFPCSVQVIATSPVPYIHVSYPKSCAFKEIRGATRVDVKWTVQVKNVASMSDQPITEGLAADLSTSGARLELHDGIAQVGDLLEVEGEVRIAELTKSLKINAVVRSRVERSTKEIEESMPAVYGVEYVDNSEEQLLLLYAFVFSLMV